MHRALAWGVVGSLLCAACNPSGGGGGPNGSVDGSTSDVTGGSDSGPARDSSTSDSGNPPDSGTPADSSTGDSAGNPDGSGSDAGAGTFSVLYDFMGGSNDGANPAGSLTVSGSTLYGMAVSGIDTGGTGEVFSIGTQGAGYSVLHGFTVLGTDGYSPYGNLTLSAGTLYGMTSIGGMAGGGTVFSVGTSGSPVTVLHPFTLPGTDGASPQGSLVLSGSTLYGMTQLGGANGGGMIFSIGTAGAGYTALHSFVLSTDGDEPYGSLVVSGTTLYGMTSASGPNGVGTIFSIGTDGTGFTVLHAFAGGASDGASPSGSLILSGSTLYGMTWQGGANIDGTVFSMATNGSGFTVLHSFAGGAADGALPHGSLLLSGNTLYGLTSDGGTGVCPGGAVAGCGTIFSIGTDGSGFAVLHSFVAATDGNYPTGDLVLSGTALYGTTYHGGSHGQGTVFQFQP